MFKFLVKRLGMNKKCLPMTNVVTKIANEVNTLKELQKVEQNERNSWWIAKSLQRNNQVQVPNSNGLSVVHLKNETNGAKVNLAGTNHTSPKNVEIVRDVIPTTRPNYVMVELRKVAWFIY